VFLVSILSTVTFYLVSKKLRADLGVIVNKNLAFSDYINYSVLQSIVFNI